MATLTVGDRVARIVRITKNKLAPVKRQWSMSTSGNCSCSLLVKLSALLRVGPRVMEFTEQNSTQLVSSPTDLMVCLLFVVSSLTYQCHREDSIAV